MISGRRIPVQIVTVPSSPEVWKELSIRNASTLSGDLEAAVSLIRGAIVAKSQKAGGCILALDLTHFGAIVSRKVVDAYLAEFGDPVTEFSFEAAWPVGPTSRSTVELARRRSV